MSKRRKDMEAKRRAEEESRRLEEKRRARKNYIVGVSLAALVSGVIAMGLLFQSDDVSIPGDRPPREDISWNIEDDTIALPSAAADLKGTISDIINQNQVLVEGREDTTSVFISDTTDILWLDRSDMSVTRACFEDITIGMMVTAWRSDDYDGAFLAVTICMVV